MPILSFLSICSDEPISEVNHHYSNFRSFRKLSLPILQELILVMSDIFGTDFESLAWMGFEFLRSFILGIYSEYYYLSQEGFNSDLRLQKINCALKLESSSIRSVGN